MFLPVTDLPAFMTYAAAMSITPGPNNAMLASLGARHGWRGAAPAAAGVVSGMFLLLVVAGTGVGAAIAAAPDLKRGLAVIGIAYLAYLAHALWTIDPVKPGKERPALGFWGAIAFQAVNPKGLLMALTAAGSFMIPTADLGGAALMAALFQVVGVPCVAAWALLGDRLRGWLAVPTRARAFSRTMALALAATALSLACEG